MRPFQQTGRFVNIMYYSGLTAMGFGVWLVSQELSTWWLVLWFIMHNVYAVAVSVGYHRHLNHKAFKCSRAWERTLSIVGAVPGLGSALQWDVLHIPHHRYSDTGKDPHYYSDWRYLFYKAYDTRKVNLWLARRHADDAFHMFIHNYYTLIVIGIGVLFYAISPMLFLFAYLIPIGSFGFVSSVHQVLSHWGRTPRDIWWMELLLPLGGEWLHGKHHAKPGAWDLRSKWYHLDPSAWLVKAIKC